MQEGLDFKISSSVQQTCLLDIITYKVEVTNKTNILLENVVVKDLLISDLKFILSSVKIDFVPDTYSNVISGVNLGNLRPNQTKTVTFDTQVVGISSQYIQNHAVLEYEYKIHDICQYESIASDRIRILVKNPNIKLIKESSARTAELGDIINYTLTLINNGDLDLENLFLVEEISNSVTLIDGSFKINNRVVNSVELKKGVSIDRLVVNQVHVITYSVKVISGGVSAKLSNSSKIRFSYLLSNGKYMIRETESASVDIDMSISSFRQISIEEYLEVPEEKPDIQCINDLKASIVITKCNVIKTPVATSRGGQTLSGYKLVVHGVLNQVVEYVACEPTQSLHSSHYSVPFSDYIVLPADFINGSKLNVEGIVDDVYFNVIDERFFFKNVSILLLAKISPCS